MAGGVALGAYSPNQHVVGLHLRADDQNVWHRHKVGDPDEVALRIVFNIFVQLSNQMSAFGNLDETEQIVTCNAAGLRILQTTPAEIVQKPFSQVFYDANAWVLEKVKRVMDTGEADITVDAEIEVAAQTLSVNLTIVPLTGADHKRLALIPTTSSRRFILSAVVCCSNTRLKVRGMASGAWKTSNLSEHDRFSCSGFDTICRNRPSNLAVPAYGR